MKSGRAAVHFRDARGLPGVAAGSARLLVGASVYLGAEAKWADYLAMYRQVYGADGLRVLAPGGYLVVVQTDAYKGGAVTPRNARLVPEILGWGYKLLDVKVWERRRADFYQPPFSLVHVFAPAAGRFAGPAADFRGVWQYPQTAGGKLNAWPDGLCRLVVEAFTARGDLIVDPFAGTARLLGWAARLGRRATGFEKDPALEPVVRKNLGAA